MPISEAERKKRAAAVDAKIRKVGAKNMKSELGDGMNNIRRKKK